MKVNSFLTSTRKSKKNEGSIKDISKFANYGISDSILTIYPNHIKKMKELIFQERVKNHPSRVPVQYRYKEANTRRADTESRR